MPNPWFFGFLFFLLFLLFFLGGGFCFWFGWFLCFLFGNFRKFSEILRNAQFLIDFRTLSTVSGLFSETELFAAPIRSASLKLMRNRCLSWTAQKHFWPIFIGQSTFVVTGALIAIIDVA